MTTKFVKISGDFDEIESVLDSEILPPGRDLAELLARKLIEAGLTVTDVDQHNSYGWIFEIASGATTTLCMVQLSDDWLLMVKHRVPLIHKFFKKRDQSDPVAILHHIDLALEESPEIEKYLWFTESEFLSDGVGTASY